MTKKDFTKYKEILDNALSTNVNQFKNWSGLIKDLKKDTFTRFPNTDINNYFVNREQILNSIIFDLGVALKGLERTVLVIAPFGSGKTTLMLHLKSIINTLKKQDPERFNYKGMFLNSNEFDKIDKTSDYLFIDDVTKDITTQIMQKYKEIKFKVLFLSPSDFDEIYKLIDNSPKVFLLHQLNFEITLDMLNKRLEYGLSKKRKISILDLFDRKALFFIHVIAGGLPLQVLKYISACLKIRLNYEDIDFSKFKNRIFRINEDIARNECKKLGYIGPFGLRNLRETKRSIMNVIMHEAKTPSELSEILKKDRTTISRHLSELNKLGFVDQTRKGREYFYVAKLVVRIQKEIDKLSEIIYRNR